MNDNHPVAFRTGYEARRKRHVKKRDEHKPLRTAAGPPPRLPCATQTNTSGCWTITTVFATDVRVTDIGLPPWGDPSLMLVDARLCHYSRHRRPAVLTRHLRPLFESRMDRGYRTLRIIGSWLEGVPRSRRLRFGLRCRFCRLTARPLFGDQDASPEWPKSHLIKTRTKRTVLSAFLRSRIRFGPS